MSRLIHHCICGAEIIGNMKLCVKCFTKSPFHTLSLLEPRERGQWNKIINQIRIDAIVIGDDMNPDDPHYARMMRLRKELAKLPLLAL